MYDNLALEPVWKDHAIALVSDTGALFNYEADRNLLWRVQRYASIAENQAGAVRKRWLISNFLADVLDDVYWGIGSATIKAKTDVTTLKIAAQAFLELLRSSPELAMQVAVILAQRLASDRRTLAADPKRLLTLTVFGLTRARSRPHAAPGSPSVRRP